MRVTLAGEDVTDKVCSCSLGRVGIVYGKETIRFPNGETKLCWTGFGLDGKGLWATGLDKPVIVLAESLKEYADRVKSRPNNVLYAAIAVPAPTK